LASLVASFERPVMADNLTTPHSSQDVEVGIDHSQALFFRDDRKDLAFFSSHFNHEKWFAIKRLHVSDALKVSLLYNNPRRIQNGNFA
jgi:hypothetical protein